MIEKIQVTRFDNDLTTKTLEAINKINEIINILNVIVIDTKDGTFIDGSKKPEPVDKFAEQRKWIGKLCKFWDKEIGEKVWGILGGIDCSENEKYPYWCDQLQEQYQCCEPVKPDDDIIYKGE